MKKVLFVLAVALMVACGGEVELEEGGVAEVRLDVRGDFDRPVFSRGSLTADGKEMSDLWLWDYVDGECLQVIHQSAGDADWGCPLVSLSMGEHRLYLVASRGESPVVDAAGHSVCWTTVRDTFWGCLPVSVTAGGGRELSVTLSRVVTKLRLAIRDEIPAEVYDMAVVPSVWYYGLDYVSGAAVGAVAGGAIAIDVPTAYLGTVGKMAVSVYSISPAEEWFISARLMAYDEDMAALGVADIADIPLLRNRATEYSGNLFGSAGGVGVALDGGWDAAVSGSW